MTKSSKTWVGAASCFLVASLFLLSMLVMSHPRRNFVAATLMDGNPALVVALCEDESVSSVYLVDSTSSDGEGSTLWRVDATRPTGRDTFVIGRTPNGFTEVVPLDDRIPDGRLAAWAIIGESREMVNTVDVGQLTEGDLYLDRDAIDRNEFFNQRRC